MAHPITRPAEGEYRLAAARRPAETAFSLPDTEAPEPSDRPITLGSAWLVNDGKRSSNWTFSALGAPLITYFEPMISDLTLGLKESQWPQGLELIVEGRPVAAIQPVDANVFIIPDAGGSLLSIYEREPSREAAGQLQGCLIAGGLLPAPASGRMDAATRRALAILAARLRPRPVFAASPATDYLKAQAKALLNAS